MGSNQRCRGSARAQRQRVRTRVPDVHDIQLTLDHPGANRAHVAKVAQGSDAATALDCHTVFEIDAALARDVEDADFAVGRRRTNQIDTVSARAQCFAPDQHRVGRTGEFPVARQVENVHSRGALRPSSHNFAYLRNT